MASGLKRLNRWRRIRRRIRRQRMEEWLLRLRQTRGLRHRWFGTPDFERPYSDWRDDMRHGVDYDYDYDDDLDRYGGAMDDGDRYDVYDEYDVAEEKGAARGRGRVADYDAPARARDDETEEEAGRRIYHVEPQDEGWSVKREGAERATSLHRTKEEAVDRARDVAQEQAPSELVIHRKDGSVQDSFSYDE